MKQAQRGSNRLTLDAKESAIKGAMTFQALYREANPERFQSLDEHQGLFSTLPDDLLAQLDLIPSQAKMTPIDMARYVALRKALAPVSKGLNSYMNPKSQPSNGM